MIGFSILSSVVAAVRDTMVRPVLAYVDLVLVPSRTFEYIQFDDDDI